MGVYNDDRGDFMKPIKCSFCSMFYDSERYPVSCPHCESPNSEKTTERLEDERKKLINRLNRIEGQIKGIKRMIEKDAYCTDILVQSSAVNAAINAFNKVLLENHIRNCVAEGIREGKDETIDELVATLHKLMK